MTFTWRVLACMAGLFFGFFSFQQMLNIWFINGLYVPGFNFFLQLSLLYLKVLNGEAGESYTRHVHVFTNKRQ